MEGSLKDPKDQEGGSPTGTFPRPEGRPFLSSLAYTDFISYNFYDKIVYAQGRERRERRREERESSHGRMSSHDRTAMSTISWFQAPKDPHHVPLTTLPPGHCRAVTYKVVQEERVVGTLCPETQVLGRRCTFGDTPDAQGSSLGTDVPLGRPGVGFPEGGSRV